MRLFRWPLRQSRLKAATYTFRLAIIAGEEPTTTLARRTYPFTLVVEKGMDPDRVRRAVQAEAARLAADMAVVMEQEVLAGLEATA